MDGISNAFYNLSFDYVLPLLLRNRLINVIITFCVKSHKVDMWVQVKHVNSLANTVKLQVTRVGGFNKYNMLFFYIGEPFDCYYIDPIDDLNNKICYCLN